MHDKSRCYLVTMLPHETRRAKMSIYPWMIRYRLENNCSPLTNPIANKRQWNSGCIYSLTFSFSSSFFLFSSTINFIISSPALLLASAFSLSSSMLRWISLLIFKPSCTLASSSICLWVSLNCHDQLGNTSLNLNLSMLWDYLIFALQG